MNSSATGEVLDHYSLNELVAKGGSASVYRAIDLRTGDQVALKIPHPETQSDAAFSKRFQREAEIGRDLDHPGVVKVLPQATINSDRRYLVMHWAEGRTLRAILNQASCLSPDRAIRIALAIAETLDYIHSNGITHRDLKPENVIVDDQDQIKLIDFGIAGYIGARRRIFTKIPNTSGTVDYISPEQVKGKQGDGRTDIYSLGIILYEMLAGEIPFQSANPLAAMNARLIADPPAVRNTNPAVSPEIEAIVLKAMQRDPGRRYATAGELSFDLTHRSYLHADANVVQLAPTASKSKKLLYYSALAAIPTSILGLMLYVAGHQ